MAFLEMKAKRSFYFHPIVSHPNSITITKKKVLADSTFSIVNLVLVISTSCA
jgi:hypothetical protein